jgi:hypothetical protein
VRARFRGANFFPHYGLDHHGYFNVGYMVICTSHAAIGHFDLRQAGLPEPDALHHHQAELWDVLRRFVFADGRLARIGGDSRVRYAYCQEYLMPSLVYAHEQLADSHALTLLDRQLELVDAEQSTNADGSFYGSRLATLAAASPYYYTRLETDRACALGMAATYVSALTPARPSRPDTTESFERSVAGGWAEPEHGAVLHRSPRRLASVSWRAFGLTQAMCQPPDDGHLAEWTSNLCGEIVVVGDQHAGGHLSRELIDQHVTEFDGGFLAYARVIEGAQLTLAEGWTGRAAAISHLAIAALPDDRTMVGLHVCTTADWWVTLASVKGLHLNLPNDLYNGYARTLSSARSRRELLSPAPRTEAIGLDSDWVCIDDRVGVVGLTGVDQLWLDRSSERRGGHVQSLYVDELCWPHVGGPRQVPPSTTVLDIGWAVLSGADAAETSAFAQAHRGRQERRGQGELRRLDVTGADGRAYRLLFNPTDAELAHPLEASAVRVRDEQTLTARIALAPHTAELLRLEPTT